MVTFDFLKDPAELERRIAENEAEERREAEREADGMYGAYSELQEELGMERYYAEKYGS